MRGPFTQILARASAARTALGAFTCYDAETAQGVLRAAAERRAPVILLVSAASFADEGGDGFLGAVCALAERSPAPACVELDHVDQHQLELMERALALGVDAVMADGSRLPFKENVEFVLEAIKLAASSGGAIEAEMGCIEGNENEAVQASSGKLTDPDEAAEFIEQARPACLAVSIGNVHGRYLLPPKLDLQRLQAIRDRVHVPLALHGASGLDAADIRRTIELGVAKVNINTELRQRYLEATASELLRVMETAELHNLHRAQTAAIADLVTTKLAILSAGPS